MPNDSFKSRDNIENLHKGIAYEDLNVEKKKIINTADSPVDATTESSQASLKTEINALTAILIESLWSRVSTEIKTHKPGLFSSKAKYGGSRKSPRIFTEEEIEHIFIKENLRSRDIIAFLQSGALALITSEWDKLIKQMEAETKNPKEKNINNQAYSRLKKLLPTISPDFEERGALRSITPTLHVERGINTALYTLWETLDILPKVYKQQFNRPMPKEKYVQLAKNSLPLIYAIAGSHLDIFSELQQKYSIYRVIDLIEEDRLLPNVFYFSGEPDNLKLELKEEFFEKIEIPKNINNPRTGCPAIFSLGPNHKNVIAEMADWFINLAEKYYLPNLKKEGLAQ